MTLTFDGFYTTLFHSLECDGWPWIVTFTQWIIVGLLKLYWCIIVVDVVVIINLVIFLHDFSCYFSLIAGLLCKSHQIGFVLLYKMSDGKFTRLGNHIKIYNVHQIGQNLISLNQHHDNLWFKTSCDCILNHKVAILIGRKDVNTRLCVIKVIVYWSCYNTTLVRRYTYR